MNRPSIVTKCNECGEETKCYRFVHRWLCEYCLDLAMETL